MSKRKTPKVNWYDTELKFEKLLEQAIEDKYIKKPITWALYKAWKWADKYEKERDTE